METLERQILDKLRSIEDRLEKIEKATLKRNLHWKAAVPPLAICRDIASAYNGHHFQTFEYEMARLSEFYGIARMKNQTDPKRVPEKSVACYHPLERTAYYKKPTCSLHTLLHEFFHHLHSEGAVYLDSGDKEEECANSFANIVKHEPEKVACGL